MNLVYTHKQEKWIWFVTFLAILLKFFFFYHFFDFGWDKLLQSIAGKNLVEGNGLSLTGVDPSDFATRIYTPLRGWPPGYSLLFAFVFFFIRDMVWTALFIDLLSVVFFFLVLRKILKNLLVQYFTICVFVLFQSLLIDEYVMYSQPTDLLSATFCLYSCHLASEVYIGLKRTFLKFTNVIPGIFRYMYFPTSFIIPFYFFWKGKQKKRRELKTEGTISLLVSFLIIATLFLFEKFYKGQSLYIAPVEKGLFLANLQTISPFIVASFINIGYVSQLLSKLTGFEYTTWIRIAQTLTVIALIFLAIKYFLFLKKDRIAPDSYKKTFIQLGGGISLFIFLLLVFLTVSTTNEYPFGKLWTYLSERRYHLFTMIFLPLILLCLYFPIYTEKENTILKIAFLILFSFEILHGSSYLIRKVIINPEQDQDSLNEKRFQQYLKDEIPKMKEKNINVVVTSTHPIFGHAANMSGGVGLFDLSLLEKSTFYASTPTLLILILKEKERIYFSNFLNNSQTKFLKQYGDYFSYQLYIDKPDIHLFKNIQQ